MVLGFDWYGGMLRCTLFVAVHFVFISSMVFIFIEYVVVSVLYSIGVWGPFIRVFSMSQFYVPCLERDEEDIFCQQRCSGVLNAIPPSIHVTGCDFLARSIHLAYVLTGSMLRLR